MTHCKLDSTQKTQQNKTTFYTLCNKNLQIIHIIRHKTTQKLTPDEGVGAQLEIIARDKTYTKYHINIHTVIMKTRSLIFLANLNTGQILSNISPTGHKH